jgi:hypothetical protein
MSEKERSYKQEIINLREELEAVKYAVERLNNNLEGMMETITRFIQLKPEIRLDDRQITMICTAILRGLNNIMLELKKKEG